MFARSEGPHILDNVSPSRSIVQNQISLLHRVHIFEYRITLLDQPNGVCLVLKCSERKGNMLVTQVVHLSVQLFQYSCHRPSVGQAILTECHQSRDKTDYCSFTSCLVQICVSGGCRILKEGKGLDFLLSLKPGSNTGHNPEQNRRHKGTEPCTHCFPLYYQ